MSLAVSGVLMQTPAPDRLQVLDAVVIADDSGTITAVHDRNAGPEAVAAADAAFGRADSRVELPSGVFLLPGLVDLHIHAPQWPQLGTGLDLPLERWLFEYTFPLEARFADVGFATGVWDHMVPTLLAHGTTTAVYFSSVHLEATTALAEACTRHGQRALVGRVAMDHPEGTPPWYRDSSASAGVDASAASIDAIGGLGDPLVSPIITPRFTPACTDALLAGLGELAEATGVRVQTHCSESDWHHGYSLQRFSCSDSEALNQFGLLRPRTVLAHANHITEADMSLISRHQAGIAHCPLSNAYFANAALPVRTVLQAGVRIGLGTDISGGASPSLLAQCNHAVTTSRMLEDGVNPALAAEDRGVPDSRIDATTAFWLATAGGAQVIDLPVGLLEPGRQFDAIAVDTTRPNSPIRAWEGFDNHAQVFEKLVRLTTPADITKVWVNATQRKP